MNKESLINGTYKLLFHLSTCRHGIFTGIYFNYILFDSNNLIFWQ